MASSLEQLKNSFFFLGYANATFYLKKLENRKKKKLLEIQKHDMSGNTLKSDNSYLRHLQSNIW